MGFRDRKYRLIKVGKRIPKGFVASGTNHLTFYQLQALRDIPEHGVKEGDLGGFITEKHNLSQKGSCWVGGEAEVYGKVSICDDVYVGGAASVGAEHYWMFIAGKVRITEDARLKVVYWDGKDKPSHAMYIRGNVQIYGNARVENVANISDDVKIYGNAKIFGAEKIVEGAEIYGDAKVLTHVKVLGNSKIYGKARVNENAVIVGSEICGAAIVQAYENATGVFVDKPASYQQLSSAGSPKAISDVAPKVSASLKSYHEIIASIEAYETDIVKILRYPVMTDRTDPFTREMIMAVNDAKRLLDEPDTDDFKVAVRLMESNFLAAESNALKIASTSLSDAERKKTDKARDLLAVASNEASTEQEKRVSFKQAFKQLEGVLIVPEKAVDNFRIKVGLPELEM